MSLINEALKKAQRERSVAPPQLPPPLVASPGSGADGVVDRRVQVSSAAPTPWPWIVGLVVLIMLVPFVVGLVMLWPTIQTASVSAPAATVQSQPRPLSGNITTMTAPSANQPVALPNPVPVDSAGGVPDKLQDKPITAYLSPKENVPTTPAEVAAAVPQVIPSVESKPAALPSVTVTRPGTPVAAGAGVATPPVVLPVAAQPTAPALPRVALPTAPVPKTAASAPSSPLPAAVAAAIEPVLAPGEPNPKVQDLLGQLRVTIVRLSDTDPRVMLNDRMYRPNDGIDRATGLRLLRIESHVLTFRDERGVLYQKIY